VRPVRLADSVGGLVEARTESDDVDLLEMDPIAFEDLIADLFRRRGLQVMTTARSGDQGVDLVATEPDPVSGGKVVIQVKRHRATITPAVVRDLYGTVIAQGAAKGILVTTSGFGPGSREFAQNKPLHLIAGAELLQLLVQHGLPGRIGG
jgi:restriction system protein